jgi:two-component sensor histidine kinase/CheY-like chemotaxis protein
MKEINFEINVLLIEDNPGDVRLIREALITVSGASKFTLEHRSTLEKGFERLNDGKIDVVLLDLTLPDSTGFTTFLKLRERFPDVTIVVLSGIDDEDLAMKIVQSGGQDYLIKGFVNEILLSRSIKYALERKQAEEMLKSSLKEKEILLKEIHHRVKNNLQVISSLLSLQSNYITDKQVLQMFVEGQNRIKSIALIHEKLYQSKDLGKVIFRDYVSSVTTSLFHSYGVNNDRINHRIEVDDVFLNIDTAIPCGLIINELVSNSLKYAFPKSKRGEIYVKLKSSPDGNFILDIGDNGVGLPEQMDFKQTETLGLQLVNKLAEQLDGTIDFNNINGTEFKINFAELNYKKHTV